MKKKFLIRVIAAIICTTILMSGCVSTTMIQSTPSGAKLYMDGEPVGTTPYTHSDTKIAGTNTIIKLTAEGYQDFNGVLRRNEEVCVGAIIGGLICWVPFLWIMEYKPMHTYELIPVSK